MPPVNIWGAQDAIDLHFLPADVDRTALLPAMKRVFDKSEVRHLPCLIW